MTPAKPLARPASVRRGSREDSIYFDPDRNRYVGAVSLGFGGSGRQLRPKVTGKTKAEVGGSSRSCTPTWTSGCSRRRTIP